MRSTLVCLFAVGCVSNWTGQKFDNQFQSRPQWPDCDGDGWGDPFADPVCVDAGNVETPDCGGPSGTFVTNGFDCDDAYDESGARVGPACPDDYGAYLGSPVSPEDYAVLAAVGREFLVWRDHPVSADVAKAICRDWAGVPSVDGTGDPVWWGVRDAVPAGVPGVVGMPESSQELQPLVAQVDEGWGMTEPWRAWIDLTYVDGAWVFTSTQLAPPPQGLSFCDGQNVTPAQIYEGLIAGAASDEFIDEIHAAVRPLLRIEGQALPCLESPTVLCEGSEGACRPEAELLCERPLQAPSERSIFQLGDLECVQVGGDE